MAWRALRAGREPVVTIPAEIVLTSNGPGELYTWARPVLEELGRRSPPLRTVISLVPCQFAAGNEAAIASSFPADAVTSPAQTLRAVATPGTPEWFHGTRGAVVSLGGGATYAIQLGAKLGYPVYRYGFEPQWNSGLTKLFVADEWAAERSRRKGAPEDRVEVVGNLVADAVHATEPVEQPGKPHVVIVPSSRDVFARSLIPFLIAVVDRMGREHPDARFIWPVSRMLGAETIAEGISGEDAGVLGGIAGTRTGDVVTTPQGSIIEMVPEDTRHAHMRAADLAITIPGTNTLELGIVGVPSIVMLPMNRPELIPLEGAGHWLGLVPVVGKYLKRYAVRLFVEGLNRPVSLPNRLSGEDLFMEITGTLTAEQVADAALDLLSRPEELARRRARLEATMPKPGAAVTLVDRVLDDLQASSPEPDEQRVRMGAT